MRAWAEFACPDPCEAVFFADPKDAFTSTVYADAISMVTPVGTGLLRWIADAFFATSKSRGYLQHGVAVMNSTEFVGRPYSDGVYARGKVGV